MALALCDNILQPSNDLWPSDKPSRQVVTTADLGLPILTPGDKMMCYKSGQKGRHDGEKLKRHPFKVLFSNDVNGVMRKRSEVEFFHAVSAGSSVKFLPAE